MVDPKKVKEDVETVVTAELLERHGKLWAARYLRRQQPHCRQLLHQLMRRVLSPLKPITDESSIEWLRWLMAGERTPEAFAEEVRRYDNAQRCGMVWTADFVAYRCRTCSVSPCMSLCAECFQRGCHDGHDYNMFRSQAGGACDCGDPYVMKEPGFCSLHGQLDAAHQRHPPDALMQIPRLMIPYIFQRLLVYLRMNSRLMEDASSDSLTSLMSRLDVYLCYLHELCNMRAAMRSCMTHVLVSAEVYREMDAECTLNDSNGGRTSLPPSSVAAVATTVAAEHSSTSHAQSTTSTQPPAATSTAPLDDNSQLSSDTSKLLHEAYRNYVDAVNNTPSPDLPAHLRAMSPALGERIHHESMLDELVFWTYKYEFPTKLVCFMLNMLPEQKYKESFTRAFVMHYARISQMLAASSEPDPLTNRVVHVSVQLFSNELLALRMTQQLHLLHAMVVSLTSMTGRIVIKSQLHDETRNTHMVANCADKIMKNHCYWPLVSDLSNVLGHRSVSIYFLSDDVLLDIWFSYLSMYQGMNVNIRQMDQHVDMEPSTYYAAFSAELEGSATPMWALLAHLRHPSTAELSRRLLRHACRALQRWHDLIGCPQSYEAIVLDSSMDLRCTFHLPLHRYVALIICEAHRRQHVPLSQLLPSHSIMLTLASHLLKLQVSFYEICAGLWVRNGTQMRGQTMTYTQCHFCCSMIDPDIYLLQLAAISLDPDDFLTLIFKKFHVWEWLSFSPTASNSFLESDQEIPMVEACLTFLATLMCVRTCAGNSEEHMAQLEIATQLCMGDKTHSQLTELLPEKSETMNNPKLFESALAQVSRYRGPASEASGNMQQGSYSPRPDVWHRLYDPVYVMLRAMVRKDFQTSMDRFAAFVKSTGEYTDSRSSPWPPYKVPADITPPPSYTDSSCSSSSDRHDPSSSSTSQHEESTAEVADVRRLLRCRTFYGAIMAVLRRCVSGAGVGEQLMALAVFLLELAVRQPDKPPSGQDVMQRVDSSCALSADCPDLCFSDWFTSTWSVDCLRRVVDNVTVPTSHVWPTSPHSDCDGMLMDTMSDDDDDVTSHELYPIAAASTSLHHHTSHVHPTSPSESSSSYQQLSAIEGGPHSRRQRSVESSSPAAVVRALPAPQQLPAILAGTELARLPADQEAGRQVDMVVDETGTDEGPVREEAVMAQVLPLVAYCSALSPHCAEGLYGDCGGGGGVGMMHLPSTSSCHGAVQPPAHISVAFGDSLISLLLRLHSKLSGDEPASFSLPSDQQLAVMRESRVGNGAHFVGQLLCFIAKKDSLLKQHIADMKARIWPQKSDEESAPRSMDHETRRRMARDRQQRLMRQFASRQKLFQQQLDNENAAAATTASADVGSSSSASPRLTSGAAEGRPSSSNSETSRTAREYDCVICGQTDISSNTRPFGVVVLLQAGSVLAHQRVQLAPTCVASAAGAATQSDNQQLQLPVDEANCRQLRHQLAANRGGFVDMIHERLSALYNDKSWLLSLNIGVAGGVHVQTCGHNVHLDCQRMYALSLAGQGGGGADTTAGAAAQNRQQNLSVARGEFSCPLCRQQCNAVLPLLDSETPSVTVSAVADSLSQQQQWQHASFEQRAAAVHQLLSHIVPAEYDHNFWESISKAMESMTHITYPRFRNTTPHSPSHENVLLFVASIARTNLEMEVVQRGGRLLNVADARAQLVPSVKRSSLRPLLTVLAFNAKVLAVRMTDGGRHLPAAWLQLTQCTATTADCDALSEVSAQSAEVPMLVREPGALLVLFVLALPARLAPALFSCCVEALYTLSVLRAAVSLCLHLPPPLRARLLQLLQQQQQNNAGAADASQHWNAVSLMVHVIRRLSDIPGLLAPLDNTASSSPPTTVADINLIGGSAEALERELCRRCLPFVRTAAVLRQHLYEQQLPQLPTSASYAAELHALADFLQLTRVAASPCVNNSPDVEWPEVCERLRWPAGVGDAWFAQLAALASRCAAVSVTCDLLSEPLWSQPRLLQLPREYKHVFLFYHRRACLRCNSVPKEPTVCLLCGALVCLRGACCRREGANETVTHSVDCGAGTGVFLAVDSCMVIIVRGRRACLWGSVYLDSFGEEDRELKRGRPLYLCQERYDLLQNLWIGHAFDNTRRRWIWHKDML